MGGVGNEEEATGMVENARAVRDTGQVVRMRALEVAGVAERMAEEYMARSLFAEAKHEEQCRSTMEGEDRSPFFQYCAPYRLTKVNKPSDDD